MTEEIPKNLRDAFHDVLANLNWRGQPHEPTVNYKQVEWAMSAICRLVDNPNFAPENVFDVLLRRLHKGAEGYPPMTYQEAARHVLEIIKRRRDDFEARHPWAAGSGPEKAKASPREAGWGQST